MKNFIWGSLGGAFVEEHKGETLSLPDTRIRKPQIVDVDADFAQRLTSEAVNRIRSLCLENGLPEHKVKDGFEKNLMLFTGSTEARDRYGDRILVDGWELEEFKSNPVFLGFHDYDAPAIGQAIDVFKDVVNPTTGKSIVGKAGQSKGKKRLRFLMLWAVEENPIAKILHGLYKGKDMRASSVGFIPGEVLIPGNDDERGKLDLGPMGVLHKKQTLLELSAVSVPALPEAIVEEDFELYRKSIPKEEVPGLRKLAEQINGLDQNLAIAVRSFLPNEVKTIDLGATRDPDLADFETELRQTKTEIQTLILPKSHWDSLEAAKKWVEDHDFKSEVDETETSYRFRQKDPGDFQDGSFRTICLTPKDTDPGDDACRVKAVIGRPKEKSLDRSTLSPEGDVENTGPGEGATHPGDKLADLDALMVGVEEIVQKEPEDGSTEDREGDQDSEASEGSEEGSEDGSEDEGRDIPIEVPPENRLVPADISEELADPADDWIDLQAEDFDFENLDEDGRAAVAGYFAFAVEIPPKSFDQLKLAHHRAGDGAVNFNGVKLSMEELLSGSGEGEAVPADERRAVYDHLAAHFAQFDEEAPEFIEPEQTEGLSKEDGDGASESTSPGDEGTPEPPAPDPPAEGGLVVNMTPILGSLRGVVKAEANEAIAEIQAAIRKEFGIDFDVDDRRGERKWRVVRAHKPATAPADTVFERDAWEKSVEKDLDLRRETCLIYDANDAKNGRSYLMPHHLAVEGTPVVFNEVKTAMRHLLSRSIDVSFSEDVRKRAYFHLRTHFEQFGKEAPAFRTLSQMAALGKFLQRTAESLASGEADDRAEAELVLDLVYMGFQAASSDAFELQALHFPKEGWEVEAASEWLRERGHSTESVQETETAFVFKQREESDFVRLEQRRTDGDEGEPSVVEIGGVLKSGNGLLSEKLGNLERLLESGITEIKQTIKGQKAGAVKAFDQAKDNGSAEDRYQRIFEQTESALGNLDEVMSTLPKA